MTLPLPLAGIKVIDAGLLVQGPQAAAYLQYLGAEVTKVELPNFGDQSRFIFVGDDDNRSAYYDACNRGKQSITLDLRTHAGAEILKQLIQESDVLISNFKPGTLETWGLGYEDLEPLNPRLIWAAGSTFGPTGPDSHREGADLAAQCAGGLVSTTGLDGDPPSPVGATIADHIGSLNMTCGILAALYARESSGVGTQVEVSLLGGQLWAQASEYTHYLLTNEVPGRANYGHPLIRATYRIFETSDGWIGLIGIPPGTFDAFLIVMGRTDVLLDARFQQMGGGKDRLKWFSEELEATFKTHSTEHWSELFKEIGIRYAPVNNYADVVSDPGVRANGYIQEIIEHGADDRAAQVVVPPLRLNGSALSPQGQVPSLGEHTIEILTKIGITPDQIRELSEQGII